MSKLIWNCKKALAAVSYDYNVRLYKNLKVKSELAELSTDEAWWLLSQRSNFE